MEKRTVLVVVMISYAFTRKLVLYTGIVRKCLSMEFSHIFLGSLKRWIMRFN